MDIMMDIDGTDRVKILIEKVKLIHRQSLLDLIYIFKVNNYDLRIAGESVRDLLLNKIPEGIDLVSSATISQMRAMFAKRNVSISNNNENGTITMQSAHNYTYKITTICPDDTHLQLTSFENKIERNWKMNAYRRIFTVDSIFLDFNGKIYDYFNGYDDIMNHQIRMNDDPVILIQEDYMRILKYFKLLGLIGTGEDVQNLEVLKAIEANIKELENIKGELIWSEIKVILMQQGRGESLERFIECGGAACLGLPDNINFDEFREVTQKCNFLRHPLLGISYLCAFLQTREDVMKLHQRLRLSAYERDLAIFLVKYKLETQHINDFVYYKQMCLLPSGANRQISREYVLELLKYHDKKMLFIRLLLSESNLITRCISKSNNYQQETAEVMIVGDEQGDGGQTNFPKNCNTSPMEVQIALRQRNESKYASLKKRLKVQ